MVFRELFYALLRRGNAMIFLKFEDTARKIVFLNIILPHLQGQGTFVLKFSLKKLPVKNFSFHGCLFKIVHAHFFFSRVKIGPIDHARFHAQFWCPNWSRVNFRFTGAFLRIDHGWVVKVSREKKNTDPKALPVWLNQSNEKNFTLLDL